MATQSQSYSMEDAPAMIDALKRKLVECANELSSANEKLASVNSALEMEKREHQMTTTKLSTLLRKRSAQPPPSAHDEAAVTDVGLLHQQIGMLQQQLRSGQEKEAQLREQLTLSAQQYEKVRHAGGRSGTLGCVTTLTNSVRTSSALAEASLFDSRSTPPLRVLSFACSHWRASVPSDRAITSIRPPLLWRASRERRTRRRRRSATRRRRRRQRPRVLPRPLPR
jgi:hypothetical protein